MKNRAGRLGIENLEDRNLMAGDVTAVWGDAGLIIEGDAADNQFQVARDTNGIQVFGLNGTTINGQSSASFPMSQFEQLSSLQIMTGDGNDLVIVNDMSVLDSLSVDTGAGHDSIQMNDVFVSGFMAVDTGAGNDYLEVTDAFAGLNESSSVQLGDGDDFAIFDNVMMWKNFTVNSGAGADDVTMHMIQSVQGSLMLDTGSGDDSLRLENFGAAQHFHVQTGDGADDLFVRDVTATQASIMTGIGNDVVGINDTFVQQLFVNTGEGDDTAVASFEANFAQFAAGDGNDHFLVGYADSEAAVLQVFMGDGDDQVMLNDMAANLAEISLGDGDDSAMFMPNSEINALDVTGDDGFDSIYNGANVKGSPTIQEFENESIGFAEVVDFYMALHASLVPAGLEMGDLA